MPYGVFFLSIISMELCTARGRIKDRGLSKKNASQSANKKQSLSSQINFVLMVGFYMYVVFGKYAKNQYFKHFAYFVITHCRTQSTACFVIPRLRPFSFVCQRVDFIDTLRPRTFILGLFV